MSKSLLKIILSPIYLDLFLRHKTKFSTPYCVVIVLCLKINVNVGTQYKNIINKIWLRLNWESLQRIVFWKLWWFLWIKGEKYMFELFHFLPYQNSKNGATSSVRLSVRLDYFSRLINYRSLYAINIKIWIMVLAQAALENPLYFVILLIFTFT